MPVSKLLNPGPFSCTVSISPSYAARATGRYIGWSILDGFLFDTNPLGPDVLAGGPQECHSPGLDLGLALAILEDNISILHTYQLAITSPIDVHLMVPLPMFTSSWWCIEFQDCSDFTWLVGLWVSSLPPCPMFLSPVACSNFQQSLEIAAMGFP